jgi:hypothetical protein
MTAVDLAILTAKAWRNMPAIFPANAPPLYRIVSPNRRFQYETPSTNLAAMYRAIGFNVKEAAL